MAWISAFFLTVFGSFNKRVNKPFNPMLGETFEFQGQDSWCVCEQVSHHPPISAMYGESKYTKIWANTAIKVNASLKGLSLNLSSLVYLHHFNPELGFYDKYEIN